MKKTIPFILTLLFQGVVLANPIVGIPLGKSFHAQPPVQQKETIPVNSGGLLQNMLSDWRVIAAGVTTLSALSGLAYYYFKRRIAPVPALEPKQNGHNQGDRDDEKEDDDAKEGDIKDGPGGEGRHIVLNLPQRRNSTESEPRTYRGLENHQGIDILRPEIEQTSNPIESKGFLDYIDQFISEDGGLSKPQQVLTEEGLQHLRNTCALKANAEINGRRAEIIKLANAGANLLRELFKTKELFGLNDAQLKELQKDGVSDQEKRNALDKSLDKIGGLMWFLFANSLARGEAFTDEGVFMLLGYDASLVAITDYLKQFHNIIESLFQGCTNPIVESSTSLQNELGGSIDQFNVELEFCIHMRYDIHNDNPAGTYKNVLPPHNYGLLRVLFLRNGRVYLKPEAVNAMQGAQAGALAHKATQGVYAYLRRKQEKRDGTGVASAAQPTAITRGIRHTGRVARLVNEFLQSQDPYHNSLTGIFSGLWGRFRGTLYSEMIAKGGLAALYPHFNRYSGEASNQKIAEMKRQLQQWFPYDNECARKARYGSEIIIEGESLRTWIANHAQVKRQRLRSE